MNQEKRSSGNQESSTLSPSVAAAFSSYDDDIRTELLSLRELILETAEETAGVGAIEETLKWGQPSYLTTETRSGSTIRIAPAAKGTTADYAMFFICHTDLVDQFRTLFGSTFRYEKNRALLFSTGDDVAEDELRQCVRMALTYHLAD